MIKNDLIPLNIKGVRIGNIILNESTDETLPRIDVGVQLIMENGMSLTSINLCNASWIDKEKQLDPDIEVFELIAKLKTAIIPAIHRTLNRQQKILDHKI